MVLKRSPFQGVYNIIRFNWHFYLIAAVVLVALLALRGYLPEYLRVIALAGTLLAVVTVLVSLFVSWYVYDVSNLYRLSWLPNLTGKKILNVNAGFDESSEIIKAEFPDSEIVVADFYDPAKHTEVSIKRARKAYPLPEGAVRVSPPQLPFAEDSFDYSLAVLSAHEIRDETEAVDFFRELYRVTKPGGEIFVTEHLRDGYNFAAYTIGFLHFYSASRWKRVFAQADLKVIRTVKTTPFVTTFVIAAHEATP